MKITGIIKKIHAVQEGTGRYGSWKRKDILIEQDNHFKTSLCLCIWDERLMKIFLNAGDKITVEIEMESRSHNNKWFTQAIVKSIPAITAKNPFSGKMVNSIFNKPRVINEPDYDDDQEDLDYSQDELDDMYKAAFENDAGWEWNVD